MGQGVRVEDAVTRGVSSRPIKSIYSHNTMQTGCLIERGGRGEAADLCDVQQLRTTIQEIYFGVEASAARLTALRQEL